MGEKKFWFLSKKYNPFKTKYDLLLSTYIFLTSAIRVLYNEILNKNSQNLVLLKCAEECSELATAILQYINKSTNYHKIKSEISDVEKYIKKIRLFDEKRRS